MQVYEFFFLSHHFEINICYLWKLFYLTILQAKYLEIILANNVRRKLEGQIATEAIMNETLDDSAERLRRYFACRNLSWYLVPFSINDSNANLYPHMRLLNPSKSTKLFVFFPKSNVIFCLS